LTLGLLAGCAQGGRDAVVDDDPVLLAPAAPTTVGPTITTTMPPVVTSTAPTVVTPPPTTAPALPVPEAPPLDRGDPGPQVGSIEIPKIGLSLPLFRGVNLATLDQGPGLWPGTAAPGQLGNTVVAAHRVSHGGPFRKIDKLAPGDEVRFTVDGVTTIYVMVSDEVVVPEGIHIIEQTPAYTATLFACHPPGSTKFRYVVKLKLAGT
jgi:sortase A